MLKQRTDGMQAHHGLIGNEAQIVFHNDLYRVYRPDGLYAKEVWVSRTEAAEKRFIEDNRWTRKR